MRFTRYSALLGAMATMALLASCGSDDNSSNNTTAPTAAATTTAAAPASSAAETPSTEATTESSGAASASGVTVAISTTPLGDILVDQDGRTLYLFQNDTAGQPSTCSGGCAATWPGLTTTGTPAAGTGVGEEDLGTVTNADGTVQVTYYGWPLYHYAEDAAAGDTHGQGVGGVWWVVDAEGNPVGAS
jgi:predicted lipoprotein with Yx(FWY)xxD motif